MATASYMLYLQKSVYIRRSHDRTIKGIILIDVLILAAVALFVLSRLYVALGRDDGPPTGRTRTRPQTGPTEGPMGTRPSKPAEPSNVRKLRPAFAGPAAEGLEAIYKADNSFDPDQFTNGAREAYKVIIAAFAAGDRTALKPLLDDDVYEAWDDAITQREASGVDPFNLLRIRKLDIDDAEMDGDIARVMIRYEAELGDGESVRTARDIWTFKREVTSPNPNWLLDDVETAS